MYILDYLSKIKNRESKIYVPIDCLRIAKNLGTDGDIVFGRLYYDLEKRFGYKTDDGTTVSFFAFQVGGEKKCINFPFIRYDIL